MKRTKQPYEIKPRREKVERYGYITDYSGATRKVKIVAETTDGRLVFFHPNFFTMGLIKKEEVRDIHEEVKDEQGIIH